MLSGERSYILCSSLPLSSRVMSGFSGCDAAIEITNPPLFAMSIARQLSGCTGGISGHCIYAANRIISRKGLDDPFPLPPPGGTVDIQDVIAAANQAGQGEEIFLKHQRFATQGEYRFVWHMDKIVGDSIVVNAPDARQFCRQVSKEEIGE